MAKQSLGKHKYKAMLSMWHISRWSWMAYTTFYQGFCSDLSSMMAWHNINAVNAKHCFQSTKTLAIPLMAIKGAFHPYWYTLKHRKDPFSYKP